MYFKIKNLAILLSEIFKRQSDHRYQKLQIIIQIKNSKPQFNFFFIFYSKNIKHKIFIWINILINDKKVNIFSNKFEEF